MTLDLVFAVLWVAAGWLAMYWEYRRERAQFDATDFVVLGWVGMVLGPWCLAVVVYMRFMDWQSRGMWGNR